jgi:PhnB protein
MSVSAVPKGHNSVSPYVTAADASGVIEFLKATFHAEVVFTMLGPGGLIAHAELRIGDSIVMVGSAGGQQPPIPGQVHCYVEDVDATYARALAAGATSLRVPTDMFYGDRISMVKDRTGSVWAISTHKEDVSPEELSKRLAKMGPPKA